MQSRVFGEVTIFAQGLVILFTSQVIERNVFFLTSTTLGMSSNSPKTTTPGAARTSLISWTQAAPLADFDKARWGSRRRPKGDLKDSVEAGVAAVDMVVWDV